MARVKIDVGRLEELQRKLRRFPKEIDRIRVEIIAKYRRKIEQEAKGVCPTDKLRKSIKVEFLPSGNFILKYSSEAKPFVDPVIRRNTEEMRKEIEHRIIEAWRT